MENQRSSLLHGSWPCNYNYFCLSSSKMQSMEELKNSLVCTTIELEAAKLNAQEELRKRDEELTHLRGLLLEAIRERNEAQEQYQRFHLQNLLLLRTHNQNQHPHPPSPPPPTAATAPISGTSTVEGGDDPVEPAGKGIDNSNYGISSSDCEESTVSSPAVEMVVPPRKPLPEKGRLLQAVMKAGPLLQTLLLAGPLPQWRHPPPPLKPFEIPPVGIGSPPSPLQLDLPRLRRKGGCEDGDASPIMRPFKYQRVVPNSIA